MDVRVLSTRRGDPASGAGRGVPLAPAPSSSGRGRVLRADYPFEWRPVRTAAGHRSAATRVREPGCHPVTEPRRLFAPQVRALVAAGLTARPALVDRPGGESRPAPGTLAVWSGSSGVPAPGAGCSACPHSTGSPRPKDDDDVAEDGAHLWES